MHIWQCFPDRIADRQIRLTGEVRVNPTLQTDFRSTTIPSLRGTPRDLNRIQQIRLIAQALACAALGKCAEPTAVMADIGVVDVSVNHIRHNISVHISP